MSDKERIKLASPIIICLSSLYRAVNYAGGSISVIDSFLDKPLREFIVHVASPNGIRFCVENKKE